MIPDKKNGTESPGLSTFLDFSLSFCEVLVHIKTLITKFLMTFLLLISCVHLNNRSPVTELKGQKKRFLVSYSLSGIIHGICLLCLLLILVQILLKISQETLTKEVILYTLQDSTLKCSICYFSLLSLEHLPLVLGPSSTIMKNSSADLQLLPPNLHNSTYLLVRFC